MASPLRCTLVGLLLLGSGLGADTAAPSLRTVLSPQEFSAAGLDKLTSTELAALEAALAAHGTLPARSAPSSRARKAQAPKETRAADGDFAKEQIGPDKTDTDKELHSRIQGTVGDMNGRSTFVLENGQVWQQRMHDIIVLPRPLTNPAVVIRRNWAGYVMDIDGVPQLVYVKRVK